MADALPISTSVAVVGAYVTDYELPIDEQQDGWFEPLIFGTNLGPGAPVLALREHFLRRRRNIEAKRRDVLNQRRHLEAYLTAWELWREGKEVSRLRETSSVPRIGPAKAVDAAPLILGASLG